MYSVGFALWGLRYVLRLNFARAGWSGGKLAMTINYAPTNFISVSVAFTLDLAEKLALPRTLNLAMNFIPGLVLKLNLDLVPNLYL